MKCWRLVIFAGLCGLLDCGWAASPETSKIYLLEDTARKQWCAFNDEATSRVAIETAHSLKVGTLIYTDNRVAQVDVTETDETGDWIVYDHYFLDDREQIVRLSRVINVLPGDRSVKQAFLINGGKAKKVGSTQTELSTQKILTSPKSVWLPNVEIRTGTMSFPFSALFGKGSLKTAAKTCVETSTP